MKIVDANIILRYILNDSEDLSEEAAKLLEDNEIFVPNEVIAEIVYVLEKVYKVENKEISIVLMELFDFGNFHLNNSEIVYEALKVYSKRKLDFVDTLLYAYHIIGKYEVYTFDKKLNNLLKSKRK